MIVAIDFFWALAIRSLGFSCQIGSGYFSLPVGDAILRFGGFHCFSLRVGWMAFCGWVFPATRQRLLKVQGGMSFTSQRIPDVSTVNLTN